MTVRTGSDHLQITVLPEYQGLKLKDVKVETDLFAGMKFSEYHDTRRDVISIQPMQLSTVVASDPKSRTGDEDKKQLLKL